MIGFISSLFFFFFSRSIISIDTMARLYTYCLNALFRTYFSTQKFRPNIPVDRLYRKRPPQFIVKFPILATPKTLIIIRFRSFAYWIGTFLGFLVFLETFKNRNQAILKANSHSRDDDSTFQARKSPGSPIYLRPHVYNFFQHNNKKRRNLVLFSLPECERKVSHHLNMAQKLLKYNVLS